MTEPLARILLLSAAVLTMFSLAMLFWYTLHRVGLRRRLCCTGDAAPGFCPGPRSIWYVTLFLPHRWFTVHACWYDLSGLSPNDDGRFRCPECGHESTRREQLRPSQSFRRGRTSLILFVLAASVLTSVIIEGRTYVKFTPTYALVAFERLGTPVQSTAMRSELRDRLRAGQVTGESARILASTLADNLRDDDIGWNGMDAVRGLQDLGVPARPALVRAMRSDDWQQRQLAFIAFQRLTRGSEEPACEIDAVYVALEALRDDDLKDYRNAAAGYRYLYTHIEDAEVRFLVRKVLRSTDDPQQRLLCAILCGFGNIEGSMADAFPLLIDCLPDNNVSGDAVNAAPAIFTYGEPVIPLLQRARKKTLDEQAIRIIDLILFDLGVMGEYRSRAEISNDLPWQFGYGFNSRNPKSILDYRDTRWLDEYVAAHQNDE